MTYQAVALEGRVNQLGHLFGSVIESVRSSPNLTVELLMAKLDVTSERGASLLQDIALALNDPRCGPEDHRTLNGSVIRAAEVIDMSLRMVEKLVKRARETETR